MVVFYLMQTILMDMQMPEMDGVTATRRIRALDGPKSKIPIIALTANAMKGDEDKYLSAGMNDYVSKPIEGDKLASAIYSQFGIVAPIGNPGRARGEEDISTDTEDAGLQHDLDSLISAIDDNLT